jgi:hypothetical protein
VTAPACGSCGSPTGDSSYLCTGCTRDLAALLLQAASIAPDLDDAVAKLLRRGSGGRRSEADAPLPVDLAASDAKADLQHWLDYCALSTWRRATDAAYPSGGIASRATWLAAHLTVVRQHPYAGKMLDKLREQVRRALAVVDRKPERAPAGLCDNCGRQLLAELGADSVTCACGMTVLALQDKRRERAAAADVLGTAAEISGALTKIGISIPRGTITSWGSRGRLTMRPGGVYAMSDVLALHAQSQRVRG